MNIQDLWQDQHELQQLWHDWSVLTPADRDQLVKELMLQLHEEVFGLQRVVDQSKYHILKTKADHNTYMVADAGVGAVRMVLAVMLLRDVTSKTFEQAWRQVGERVKGKARWERDALGNTTVLMCDLDGVVALYTEGFRKWCAEKSHDIKTHINTPEMEIIKDEFHSTGGFRTLRPMPGAIQVLNQWRGEPSPVKRRLVMVTARPYKQYKQVYGDTVAWLGMHGLRYDHILFERDKAEAVRQLHPANIIAHIEDRGKHAIEVAHTGTTVYKLPFEAPEEQVTHPLIIPVNGWADLENILLHGEKPCP